MNVRPSRSIVGLLLAVICAVLGWWCLRTPDDGPSGSAPVSANSTAKFEASPERADGSRSSRAIPEPLQEEGVAPRIAPQPQFGTAQAATVPSRGLFAGGWRRETKPPFAAFDAWVGRYLAAPADERPALIAEGIALAQLRRDALADLIRRDPREAIASAVPATVRTQLPPEILAMLEERVAGEGRLSLLGVLPAPGGTVPEPTFRTAAVNGHEYRAYIYGRRETQATKVDISVLGVALDGALAVSDSPVRVLEPGEILAAGKPVIAVCPISGLQTPVAERASQTGDALTTVEVGGRIYQLCHVEHVANFEQRLIRAENEAGPYAGSLQAAFTQADGQPGTSGVSGRPPLAWSTGTKKVLIIRVDFSDKTGTPVNPGDSQQITQAYAANVFTVANGINDFYAQASYGQTALSISTADVSSTVYRMPQTAAYYAVGNVSGAFNDTLHADAENLATAGGFNLATYDRIGVVFSNLGSIPSSKITYGGLGEVVGKNFWINGYFDFRDCSHEIGHNYGLQHCNLWQVSDGNPVSASGTSTEYGDPFGVMGSGTTDIKFHFDMWEKSILHWIPDTSVTTVNAAGTYRVYRFDHAGANTANQLALKIVRNSTQDYWIGLRQLFTANTSLMNGAYILWGYNSVVQGNLLDMTTPGANAQDAALAAGASFHDTAAGVTIHPLVKGGTAPNEYLDVQVDFDPRIQWQATTYNVDQQFGTVTLTLTRTLNSTGAVSVPFSTTDGTATAPANYTTQSGTISWAGGDSSPKTITIPIATGAVFTGLKTFSVTLGAITGGVIVNSATATVNIASPGTGNPAFHANFVNNVVLRTIVQPDGKTLIGGWFSSIQDAAFVNYTRGGFARMNADGSVDTAFGNGSGVNTAPVYAMALQPDGKVLIAGNFTTVHGVTRNRVARLNADGSLDLTFDPGTGSGVVIRALVLQPDGKIIVGGDFTTFAGTAREYLARLNADGTLDTGFVGPDFGGTSGFRVHALALQPDSKVLVGGTFYFSGGPFPGFKFRAGIIRTNASGSVDTTFDSGDGAHAAGSTGSLQPVQTIAVQRDGLVIIGGDFTAVNNVPHNHVARLTATGTPDAGFVPNADDTVGALLVQADGKILVGGKFLNLNSSALNHFARLNTGGTLDTAFNVGTGSTGEVHDFATQPDGKVMLGADFGTIQGVSNVTLAQLFTGIPGLPGTVQFAPVTYTGTEGNGLTVTASRTGGSYGAVSVSYATIPGTAAATRYTPVTGTLSWADGDSANKTFSVPLLNDNIAQADQTFSLGLGIPIGGLPLGSPWNASATITMAYTLWKNSKFTAAELLDPTVSGDLADFDRDGVPTQLEYAYGFEPKTPNSANLPSSSIQNVAGSNYLTLSFRRVPTAGDLTYTPQSGPALGTWTGAPVQVGSPVTNADGTQTVTYRDSVPITPAVPQRFMRLQVTRSP